MLKPLVNLEDLTAKDVSEAYEEGRLSEGEARRLNDIVNGKPADAALTSDRVWALRIRMTHRERLSVAHRMGVHYATMARVLARGIAIDTIGVTVETEGGERFTGMVGMVNIHDGRFALSTSTSGGGLTRIIHFDEIPSGRFGTYNREG